jgi:hypothetical protein
MLIAFQDMLGPPLYKLFLCALHFNLEIAYPTLIEALASGTLKINRAMQFCKLPRAEQVVEFMSPVFSHRH